MQTGTNTFGLEIALTPASVTKSLQKDRENGLSHVYAEKQGLLIFRSINRYSVVEYAENRKGKYKEILTVDYNKNEQEEAVQLFFQLLKSPYKKYRHQKIKKLGDYLCLPIIRLNKKTTAA